jgi:hypothetical protein
MRTYPFTYCRSYQVKAKYWFKDTREKKSLCAIRSFNDLFRKKEDKEQVRICLDNLKEKEMFPNVSKCMT